jgi:hypothetical protein
MASRKYTKDEKKALLRKTRRGQLLSYRQLKKLCLSSSKYVKRILKNHFHIQTSSEILTDYAIEAFCAIEMYDFREFFDSMEFKEYMKFYKQFEQSFEAMRLS